LSRSTLRLLVDGLTFVSLALRSRTQLAAENLFLRKQLAFYRERQVKPRRADDATRHVKLTRMVRDPPSMLGSHGFSASTRYVVPHQEGAGSQQTVVSRA